MVSQFWELLMSRNSLKFQLHLFAEKKMARRTTLALEERWYGPARLYTAEGQPPSQQIMFREIQLSASKKENQVSNPAQKATLLYTQKS